jgi:hypothetical protein
MAHVSFHTHGHVTVSAYPGRHTTSHTGGFVTIDIRHDDTTDTITIHGDDLPQLVAALEALTVDP